MSDDRFTFRPPKWLADILTDYTNPLPHSPRCGSLSVPDVLIVCQTCHGDTKWCGCMYRCPKCEAK